MTHDNDVISCRQFLQHVLPSEGYYCWVALKKGEKPKQGFVRTIDELAEKLRQIDAEGYDAYFACASYKAPTKRKAENVKAVRCFWTDIDYGAEGHSTPGIYSTEDETMVALDAFCERLNYPYPSAVSTGGGVHAYWRSEQEMTREVWEPRAKHFKAITQSQGLHADHACTANIVCILRAPETHNYKIAGRPRPVTCDELMDGEIKFDATVQPVPPVAQSFHDLSSNISNSAAAIYASSPPAYAEVAATKCAQLAKFRDEKGNFDEPLWYAGLGVLAHCADGEQLAQEWSSGHPEYSAQATTAKLKQARDASGSTTCKRFKDINPAGCVGCPFTGTSPIQLGRMNNAVLIASAFSPWSEPQPFTSKSVAPPYPLDALPDAIREAVEEVQAFVQAPPAMVASSALAALSIAAQPLADVKRDEKLTGPVGLYFLTIADSGERKTKTDDFFTTAIRNYERQKQEEAKPAIQTYQADMRAWKAKQAGISEKIKLHAKTGKPTKEFEDKLIELERNEPVAPRVPRLTYTDATPEALTFNLAKTYPAAGVVSSEGGIVFGAHGMNRDTIMRNLSTFNILWDGGEYQSDRRTSGSYAVRGARVTIALQVQSATLREFFDRAKSLVRGSGFLARFLIAMPETTQGTRFYRKAPDHWPKLAAFHTRIETLLSQVVVISPDGALLPFAMPMMADAQKIWIEFHDNIERELRIGGALYDVRDVASKITDNAARLAALFQIFKTGVSAIEGSAIHSACRIVEWHLNEAQRFFGELALPEELANASRVETWLTKVCGKEQVSCIAYQRLRQGGPVRDKVKLDLALNELISLSRVQVIQGTGPKEVHINPALLTPREAA